MKKLFFLVSVLCFRSTLCLAESCTAMPSCVELGYYMGTNIACGDDDSRYIHCPYDHDYRKCINYDCEEMGFKKDAREELLTWCEEDKIVECEFDPSYVLCKDIKLCEDPVPSNPTECITAENGKTNCGEKTYKYACTGTEICYAKHCVTCDAVTPYSKEGCITKPSEQPTNCGENTYEYACDTSKGETCYDKKCLVCEAPTLKNEAECYTKLKGQTNCGEDTYEYACNNNQTCDNGMCVDCVPPTPYNEATCYSAQNGTTNCGVPTYKYACTSSETCYNSSCRVCETPTPKDVSQCITHLKGKTNCGVDTYEYACNPSTQTCKNGECVNCEAVTAKNPETCVTKETTTNCGAITYKYACDTDGGETCYGGGCVVCQAPTQSNSAQCITKLKGKTNCGEDTYEYACDESIGETCYNGTCVVCEQVTPKNTAQCIAKPRTTNCDQTTYSSECVTGQICVSQNGVGHCEGCEEVVEENEDTCYTNARTTNCDDTTYEYACADTERCYNKECRICEQPTQKDVSQCITHLKGKTNCGEDTYEYACDSSEGETCYNGECLKCETPVAEDPSQCLTVLKGTTNCGVPTYISKCSDKETCYNGECVVCEAVYSRNYSLCRTVEYTTNCGKISYKSSCDPLKRCVEGQCLTCDAVTPYNPAECVTTEKKTNCNETTYEYRCNKDIGQTCYNEQCLTCDEPTPSNEDTCVTKLKGQTNCGVNDYEYACDPDTQACLNKKCVDCEAATPYNPSECITKPNGKTNCGVDTFQTKCEGGWSCHNGECVKCVPPAARDEDNCITTAAKTNCNEDTFVSACAEDYTCYERECVKCKAPVERNEAECLTEATTTNCGVTTYVSRCVSPETCYQGECKVCATPVQKDEAHCIRKQTTTNCGQITFVTDCSEGETCHEGECKICEAPVSRNENTCYTVESTTNCGQTTYEYRCNREAGETCYNGQCLVCEAQVEQNNSECITVQSTTNCGKTTYLYGCDEDNGYSCYNGQCLKCETPVERNEAECLTEETTTNCGETTYVSACEDGETCYNSACVVCQTPVERNEEQCLTAATTTNCGKTTYEISCDEDQVCSNGACVAVCDATQGEYDECPLGANCQDNQMINGCYRTNGCATGWTANADYFTYNRSSTFYQAIGLHSNITCYQVTGCAVGYKNPTQCASVQGTLLDSITVGDYTCGECKNCYKHYVMTFKILKNTGGNKWVYAVSTDNPNFSDNGTVKCLTTQWTYDGINPTATSCPYGLTVNGESLQAAQSTGNPYKYSFRYTDSKGNVYDSGECRGGTNGLVCSMDIIIEVEREQCTEIINCDNSQGYYAECPIGASCTKMTNGCYKPSTSCNEDAGYLSTSDYYSEYFDKDTAHPVTFNARNGNTVQEVTCYRATGCKSNVLTYDEWVAGNYDTDYFDWDDDWEIGYYRCMKIICAASKDSSCSGAHKVLSNAKTIAKMGLTCGECDCDTDNKYYTTEEECVDAVKDSSGRATCPFNGNGQCYGPGVSGCNESEGYFEHEEDCVGDFLQAVTCKKTLGKCWVLDHSNGCNNAHGYYDDKLPLCAGGYRVSSSRCYMATGCGNGCVENPNAYTVYEYYTRLPASDVSVRFNDGDGSGDSVDCYPIICDTSKHYYAWADLPESRDDELGPYQISGGPKCYLAKCEGEWNGDVCDSGSGGSTQTDACANAYGSDYTSFFPGNPAKDVVVRDGAPAQVFYERVTKGGMQCYVKSSTQPWTNATISNPATCGHGKLFYHNSTSISTLCNALPDYSVITQGAVFRRERTYPDMDYEDQIHDIGETTFYAGGDDWKNVDGSYDSCDLTVGGKTYEARIGKTSSSHENAFENLHYWLYRASSTSWDGQEVPIGWGVENVWECGCGKKPYKVSFPRYAHSKYRYVYKYTSVKGHGFYRTLWWGKGCGGDGCGSDLFTINRFDGVTEDDVYLEKCGKYTENPLWCYCPYGSTDVTEIHFDPDDNGITTGGGM